MNRITFTALIALTFAFSLYSLQGSTIRFYLDPASPTPRHQPDRNALSDGDNEIGGQVWFSVDRVAVGALNTDVFDEALPGIEEAHGDVFRAPGNFRLNRQTLDEEELGLVPGFFGDDIDGLDLCFDTGREYFSVDYLSPLNGGGTLERANDIFLNSLTMLYAEGAQDIGLSGDDDLDALALFDEVNPGTLDPGDDYALFSIDTFSPSVGTTIGTPSGVHVISPGDIFYTEFGGSFELWATAESLGLRADDELDALWVPEPALHVFVLPIAILGLTTRRRRQPQKH